MPRPRGGPKANDIVDDGWGELSSSSPLDPRAVFHVGVRILAVFDCCLTDSALVFFSIGGGRDEPLLLPFSSSTVGG
jgi:hypothetical protein